MPVELGIKTLKEITMKFGRLAVAALLVLAVATSSMAAAKLPWKTFSEQAKDGVSADLGTCGADQEFFTAYFVSGDDAYRSFYGVSSNRYILLVYVGNKDGAPPDRVGLGAVDPAKHDDIPPLEWITLEQAKVRYPSLCDALYPNQA